MSQVLKFVTDPNEQLMAIPANNVNSKYGYAEVIVGPHFNNERFHKWKVEVTSSFSLLWNIPK